MQRALMLAAALLATCSIAAIARPAHTGTSNHPDGYGGQGPAEYFLQHPDELRRNEPSAYTDGSVRRLPPVPNASGSQVTNPNTYRKLSR
jgi:hypothetical protein